MAKVDVVLNGRTFPVVVGDGEEERVVELAHMVDATVRRIAHGAQGATDTHLLALASLALADRISDLDAEVRQLRAEMDELRASGMSSEEQEQVTAAVEHLTQRVEDIAARLRSA